MKAQKILLSLFFVLFGLGMNGAFAQSTTSPDTVCAGTTGVSYWVTATSGSSYVWVVNGGTQASGGSTNSITVDWSSTAGTDTLKVVEINSNGCPGDTVKLAVYRMPLPTAQIVGGDTICWNNSSSFDINFTGVGPWNVKYYNGTDTVTVNGITTSTYNVVTPNLTSTTTYSLVSVSNFYGCNGTTSGTAIITVIPKPTTSGIFHN